MPATELAAAYGAGHTTPSQVLRSTLDRLDDVNPRVNAVVTLDAAGALAAARASTLRWQRGEPLGPLDGVTVTIKDNLLVAGLVSTWGSKLYAGLVPQADEQPVARLRAAGAVIIGKTNVPEFTLHGNTDNALFGPTRNPWNLALTPGGSSGGRGCGRGIGHRRHRTCDRRRRVDQTACRAYRPRRLQAVARDGCHAAAASPSSCMISRSPARLPARSTTSHSR